MLAIGTVMCSPLTDDDTLDRGAADGAGLTLALIDAEFVLKMAPLVCPVKGGAVLLDGMCQCLLD